MPRLRGDNSDLYEEEYDPYAGQDTSFLAGPVPNPNGPEPPQAKSAPTPTAAGPTNPTEWSRGMEDNWINYTNQNYGGKASGNLSDIVNGYNQQYNTNARVVGSDKVDFGFGPADVIKDVGGANQLWLGDYADPNGVSPNSRPSGSGGGAVGGTPQTAYYGGSGGSGGQSSGSGSYYGASGPMDGFSHQNHDDIMAALKQLFPNGAYNQDLVNRQTEGARENLLRQRKSTDATNKAILAAKGTLGSGPEITALTRADQDTNDRYANAATDIYANESHNASQRMMQALQTAAGMDANDAQNVISAYMAQTGRGGTTGALQNAAARNANDFSLGQGNLALGNMNGINSYNLGLANFGLNRDNMLFNQSHQSVDDTMKLIDFWLNGSNTAAGGHR